VGSSEGGAWRVCNSRALCGIGGLDELGRAGGEGNASRIADAGCGEEVLGLLFAEAMPVTRTSGRGVATTASMVVVTLVVIAVTGALACLWYRRRKARANVLDFRDTQITKMGPVLAVPSLSSFSGSNQGLIQGSPVTVRSSEQPTPFQEEPKPPMLMTNIDVSGIRLSIPIGKGAFATVYKASWVGKTVAVKILQHPPDQKTLPEKSLFEAQLGFTVMHANLVHTLGTQTKRCQDLGMITPRSSRPSSTSLDKPMSFAEDFVRGQSRASSDCFSDMADVLKAQGKEEYETWIVMEYCDQGSLQGAIQRGAFFDNAEKTNLRLVDILLTALDIARGMEHLHAMSIVHGDLKPRNVLMKTKKGDVRGYICKVGDFGFSRSVPDCHLTTATCGAVNYMPPELLAQGILTPSADVYSFGVLLWELLVGGNPYPSKTHNEIIVLVTSGRRPNVPSRVPAPCTDLLKRCWHQSRQARPTFTEISTTLKELLADPNMEWRPWRPPTSRGRPPRSSSQMVMGFSFENPLAPPAPLPSPLSSSVVSVLASPLASQGENPLLSPIRSSVASSIISPLPSPLPSPVPSSTASFMATSNPTTYRSEASDLPPPAPVPKGRPSGKDPLSPLQDFPPTPQDIQSGAPLACVTSDSMKNLFLKDLEMSAGQGMLPQFDDLLATVKICQRPRIPTGKKADAVEGSDGGKGSRQRPPVPQSCRKG